MCALVTGVQTCALPICGDYLALAFLDQHNGHSLANTFSSYVMANAGTLAVQRQMHRWFLGLIVQAGLRVGKVVASQNYISAERRLGQECESPFYSRWSPYH